jgi:hypothetical protein
MKFRTTKPFDKKSITVGKCYFIDFHDERWPSYYFYKGKVKVTRLSPSWEGQFENRYFVQRIPGPQLNGVAEWFPESSFIREVTIN